MEVEGEVLASCRDVQSSWTRLLRWVSSDSEETPNTNRDPADYLTSTRGEYSSAARLAEPSTIVKYFKNIATLDEVLNHLLRWILCSLDHVCFFATVTMSTTHCMCDLRHSACDH